MQTSEQEKRYKRLQTYVDMRSRIKRAEDIIGDWQMNYQIEKLQPLIDDGFDAQDIVEYFEVKLLEFMENKVTDKEEV
jgi:hypothetical protein|tara:strand:+ start:223 stop:456 length:234 start_codon:yes stop_codon:yes gene_type:complete